MRGWPLLSAKNFDVLLRGRLVLGCERAEQGGEWLARRYRGLGRSFEFLAGFRKFLGRDQLERPHGIDLPVLMDATVE